MKRFRFNLQRVLDYRQTIEDALLAELAAIQAEHNYETERLAEMTTARDSFRQEIKERLSKGDPEEIRQAYAYLHQLTWQVSVQESLVRRLAQRKREKTDEVVEAAKDRKALERLREQKADEHKHEAEREEQKFLDDIAGTRHERMRSAA